MNKTKTLRIVNRVDITINEICFFENSINGKPIEAMCQIGINMEGPPLLFNSVSKVYTSYEDAAKDAFMDVCKRVYEYMNFPHEGGII